VIAQTMPARRGVPGTAGTNGTNGAPGTPGAPGADGVPGWSFGVQDYPGTINALATVNVDVPISPALATVSGVPVAPAKIVAEVYGAPSLLANLRPDAGSITVLNASTVRVPITSLLVIGTLTGAGVKVTIKR